MSNLNGIRIGGALFFSVAVHVILMGMDFGGETALVSPIPQRKVKIRLIKRQVPPVARKEVVPPKKTPKPEPLEKSLPESVPLAKPVVVVVKEIPPVSLPSAPVVPEPKVEAEFAPQRKRIRQTRLSRKSPLNRQRYRRSGWQGPCTEGIRRLCIRTGLGAVNGRVRFYWRFR